MTGLSGSLSPWGEGRGEGAEQGLTLTDRPVCGSKPGAMTPHPTLFPMERGRNDHRSCIGLRPFELIPTLRVHKCGGGRSSDAERHTRDAGDAVAFCEDCLFRTSIITMHEFSGSDQEDSGGINRCRYPLGTYDQKITFRGRTRKGVSAPMVGQ